MKKIFNNMVILLAGVSALTVSCKDDDTPATDAAVANREFMTMFINSNTIDKGDDYPYYTGLDANYPHGNTVHLYWFGVNDCRGYQVQMSTVTKVANGVEAWRAVQGTTDLLLDTVVGPDVLQLVLKDLQYSMSYRFAIRALSKKDQGLDFDSPYHSKWYGHGNGRQWQEYQGVETSERYETPYAIYVNQAETTEKTMHLYLNHNIKNLGLDYTNPVDREKVVSYVENFNLSNIQVYQGGVATAYDQKDTMQVNNLVKLLNSTTNIDSINAELGFTKLSVQPSPNNPNASVNAKWKDYTVTQEDIDRGYVVVDGLEANAVYVIDAIDPTVAVAIDAKFNTVTARSDGKPGAPILLSHAELMAKNTDATCIVPNSDNVARPDAFADAVKFDAAPISDILYDFINNTNYAEGQTFLLEGGKTYYLDGNDITCKGFVLRTDPADVAQGKRAKVICGIGKSTAIYSGTDGEQRQGSYTTFMFGRQPEAGEGGEIYMKKLAFYDIDFDNPTAINYGDNLAGVGTISGNYFFNMYSNGMAVTLDSLVIENCSFKRLVRGFIREQGANYKIWKHVLIHNNLFLDCGYYNNAAGGYPWIAGSGSNKKSNLYSDFQVTENTFYDSPFPCFFSETSSQSEWENGIQWHITFSNNTLVNFNTRGDGGIIKMRYIPDGSSYTVQNNLIVLTKKPGDNRVLQQYGADMRYVMTLPDGSSGKITLKFGNNWSTNDNLTEGQIFSASPWNATKNNFGTFVKEGSATLSGSLDVAVASVSSTELMEQPCPPHVSATASDQHMHRADALDGTATTEFNVNLKIKNQNNEIYQNNVGAARWR